jgi:DNA-binding CsgD family transcriptional regulator
MAVPLMLRPGTDVGALSHPWLRALESFHIPFICYDADGRRVFTAAEAGHFERVAQQADRAVATQLQLGALRTRSAGFERAGEVAVSGAGVTMSIYLATAFAECAAVVILHPYVAKPRRSIGSGRAALTTREQEVAEWVSTGLSTKEIAQRLGISVHTARHHTERVFAKLGVRSRAALASMIVAGGELP